MHLKQAHGVVVFKCRLQADSTRLKDGSRCLRCLCWLVEISKMICKITYMYRPPGRKLMSNCPDDIAFLDKKPSLSILDCIYVSAQANPRLIIDRPLVVQVETKHKGKQ